MYPILADLGFFDASELKNVCKQGSFLEAIPDPNIPGYETVNGSLGNGLGVAYGYCKGIKRKELRE
jgi:transketolase